MAKRFFWVFNIHEPIFKTPPSLLRAATHVIHTCCKKSSMPLPKVHFSPTKTRLTDAAVWSPRFSQSHHLRRGVKIAPLCRILAINQMPNLDHANRFVTHFIFFFPSNLLLREAIVRPAGSGGGGGASGAGARTRVTDGVSGGGIDGRPRASDVPVRVAAAFLSLPRRGGVPNTALTWSLQGRKGGQMSSVLGRWGWSLIQAPSWTCRSRVREPV